MVLRVLLPLLVKHRSLVPAQASPSTERAGPRILDRARPFGSAITSGRRELLGGTVPLSEHEQRQLEQIEQALYAEHPRFAKAVRAADPRVHHRRRVVYAAIGFAIGLVLLPVGISTNLVELSVAGFVVMLGCCYWAALSYRRMNGLPAGRVSIKERRPRRRERKASRSRRSGSGFGVRLEERWRRRQEGQGK
jgi:hypothetical protein